MSKGGSNKVEITEEQKALADTAAQEFNRFITHDLPAQEEAIARTSGLRWNRETGKYDLEVGGALDGDGNIKTDAIAANASNEAAYTNTMKRADPNRLGLLEDVNTQGAVQGAQSAANQQLGQQTSYLKGLGNLAAMGRGEQQQVLQSQTQLASNAQADAFNSAQQAAQANASRSALAGQVVGAGIGVGLYQGGYMDANGKKITKPDANPMTPPDGMGP